MTRGSGANSPDRLHCHYFEAGRCRSCSLIETPYSVQLREKEAGCRALLPQVPKWLPVFSGGERGFRNRVKLVVGGVAGPAPGSLSLGIQGPDGRGVDLRECAIQSPGIAAVIPLLASFLEATELPPYAVASRKGELKFVHITEAPPVVPSGAGVADPADRGGELMLRFVVRSQYGLDVLRSRLGQLRRLVPRAAVISVNLLPEHKAVLEGEREELLLGESLPMRLGLPGRPLTLHLRPQSFFQTNTVVARELYAQVASWAAAARPRSLWDLYCGVGGFALHVAASLGDDAGVCEDLQACEVIGVEVSEAAIESARRSSTEAGLEARFEVADATAFALAARPRDLPEMLIVNPPRRGIGTELAEWIEGSGIDSVVYSSCNPVTLARDLEAMPSYSVLEGRVFDMFPHTSHLEVAVLLERAGLPRQRPCSR